MNNYVVYGRKPDGTLSVCRATPEFRGKGTCKHGEHMEMEKSEGQAFVKEHNEKILAEILGGKRSLRNNQYPEQVSADHIQSHSKGAVLSKEELTNGANKIAASFRNEDWKMIQDFYSLYHRRLSDAALHKKFEDASANIADYLKSDDDTAVKLREFLGRKVDLDELSSIIVYQVKAMTAAEKWRINKRASMTRIIFSSLNNDMTKERYVASVLFFGGRCCYCNAVLRKNPPPGQQASGEHITPLAPEKEGSVHGGTRYGNMALACVACNADRKNTDLVEWIQKTRCIPLKDKKFALGRIQAFREFALYEDYSQEESDRIAEKAKELQDFVSSQRVDGVYFDDAEQKIQEKIKIALYDLRHNNENDEE